VQLADVGYLLGLGLKAGGQLTAPRHRRGRGLGAGYPSNLLNPKAGPFFLAVIPQFTPARSS